MLCSDSLKRLPCGETLLKFVDAVVESKIKTGPWQAKEKEFAAANTDGVAGVHSVSCGAVGDCSAGGSYKVGTAQHAFLTAVSAPLTESTTTTTTTTEAPPTLVTGSPSSAVM